MAILMGYAEKLLNRQVSRLKYEGEVMDDCKAVLGSICDGGVVIVCAEGILELQSSYSHKLPELGACSLQDVGQYQFEGVKAPIGLIQLSPMALKGRPVAEITGATMLGKSYALAPGVKIPGTPIAFVFCSMKNTDKDGPDPNGELLQRCMSANEGYVAKTSNKVSLITFEAADNAFNFIEAIGEAASETPTLRFAGALHLGIPVSVVPSKTDGRAEYKGPITKSTARLMALAGDHPIPTPKAT